MELKRLKHMTREQVAAHLKQCRTAVLPLGSTEQHGPHLPLGTDTILAEKLSEEICRKWDFFLFPALEFGYSWVWQDIPGTLTIPETMEKEIIKTISASVSRWGIEKLILINGHDANNAAMKYAARDISDRCNADTGNPNAAGKTIDILYLFYPGISGIRDKYCESGTWNGIFHACEFETSLMLHTAPEMVDMSQAADEYPEQNPLYGVTSLSLGTLSKSGVYGSATLATADKGKLIFNETLERMNGLISSWQTE